MTFHPYVYNSSLFVLLVLKTVTFTLTPVGQWQEPVFGAKYSSIPQTHFKSEAIFSSETLATICQTTEHHIQDVQLHLIRLKLQLVPVIYRQQRLQFFCAGCVLCSPLWLGPPKKLFRSNSSAAGRLYLRNCYKIKSHSNTSYRYVQSPRNTTNIIVDVLCFIICEVSGDILTSDNRTGVCHTDSILLRMRDENSSAKRWQVY